MVLPGYKHTPFALLSDELAQRTITFHAASKTFNLAGLATSTAIIANPELRTNNTYLHALEADLGNIFGKAATQTAMNQGDDWLAQLLEYVQGNVDYVSDFLRINLPKIKFFKPEATYMIYDVARFFHLRMQRRRKLAQADPASPAWLESRQRLRHRRKQPFSH